MHFMNQRATSCREEATVSKPKRLPPVEAMTDGAERWESHPPDTDSRLLTEMIREEPAIPCMSLAGEVAPRVL
jgi:hypothetical protein